MSIVRLSLFPNLNSIINSIEVQCIRSHFSEHIVPIIPNSTEPQHLTIQVDELFEFVECGRCNVTMLGLLSGEGVGIRWARLRGIEHDSLACHEVFGVVVAVVDVECFAVEDYIVADIQIFPLPVLS